MLTKNEFKDSFETAFTSNSDAKTAQQTLRDLVSRVDINDMLCRDTLAEAMSEIKTSWERNHYADRNTVETIEARKSFNNVKADLNRRFFKPNGWTLKDRRRPKGEAVLTDDFVYEFIPFSPPVTETETGTVDHSAPLRRAIDSDGNQIPIQPTDLTYQERTESTFFDLGSGQAIDMAVEMLIDHGYELEQIAQSVLDRMEAAA